VLLSSNPCIKAIRFDGGVFDYVMLRDSDERTQALTPFCTFPPGQVSLNDLLPDAGQPLKMMADNAPLFRQLPNWIAAEMNDKCCLHQITTDRTVRPD
jgi:hypothetical protein